MFQFLPLVLLIVRSPHYVVESLSSSKLPKQQGTQSPPNKLVILGLGRVGSQIAHLAGPRFKNQVVGTVRKKQANSVNDNDDGFVRILFDPPAVQKHLVDDGVCSTTTHVLLTIPLSKEPDPVLETILNLAKEWWRIPALPGQSDKWMGILSTTGVYGNHDGAWVTEESPLLCEVGSTADLYRRLEEDWMQFSQDLSSSSNRLCIFRCAGIYDSSRSALHTVYNHRMYGPQALSSPTSPHTLQNRGKTNRIHSLDLSRAVLASMLPANNRETEQESCAVRIYNLADNLPEYRGVVLAYAKGLLSSIADGLPSPLEPALDTNDLLLPSRASQGRMSRRQQEQKLVDNNRMRRELLGDAGHNETAIKLDGKGLWYPTYREGLQAIFEDPSTPWQLVLHDSPLGGNIL